MEKKSKSKEKVIVIGGSGYIGIHIVKEFLRKGYSVTVASRNPERVKTLLPESVQYLQFDINSVSQKKLEELLKGFDYLIYATGVDDRVIPKAPAYDFFYTNNVLPTIKTLTAAKSVNIKKAVLLSSYFCYLNRKYPEMELTKYHAYIKTRVEQQKGSLEASLPNLKLTILEIPYVIGSNPNDNHLLNPLVKYLHSNLPTFITTGGTAIIVVENIAQAVLCAIEKDLKESIYPIADRNISWKQFAKEINSKKIPITIPKWILKTLAIFIKLYYWILGKESGVDPVHFIDIQTMNSYIPVKDTQSELKFGKHSVKEAFEEIIQDSDC